MTSPIQVRRFLHCNYNCRDVDSLERFYVETFEMKPVMRSQSDGSDGTPFGIFQTTLSKTSFLYDHRGGRRANALELVQWIEPATIGTVYPNGWDRGIQSVAFSVSDLEATAARAVARGASVVRQGDGWMLLRDPEGVAVEVIEADGRPEARYLRVVCSDLDRTVAWWAQLGFVENPTLVARSGQEIWPGDGERSISAERAIVGTDDPTFGVVFTTWSGPPPVGPTYGVPYHQGIYRMAVAVEDVQASYESLLTMGVARQPPYTFQLPGTPLTNGLTILFIRDPDGILVELVGRPRQPQ